MAIIKEFKLMENETIIAQIEGDAFNDSSNPIAKIIAFIVKIIYLIFGVRIRTYIIATNLRVVQIDKKKILWGLLPGDISVVTLNKNSIQSVGYMTSVSWFIFKAHYFVITNYSGLLKVTFKGSPDELINACEKIDNIVCGK